MYIRKIIAAICGRTPQLDHQQWPEAHEDQLAEELRDEAKRRAAEKLTEWRRKLTASQNLEYEAHVQAVDLSGMAERCGYPLSVSEIETEVKRRCDLAQLVQRDPQVKLSTSLPDEVFAKILDRANRHYLIDHEDSERQRKTAKAVMDARADLDPIPPIRVYATAVANIVARSRCEGELSDWTQDAVVIRAILLRSTDLRWTRIQRGSLQRLSEPPFR